MPSIKALHNIMANANLGFEDKIARLLQLGSHRFALDLAIISQIAGEVYTVRFITGPEGAPAAGTNFPLGETYCSHTLQANGAVSFHHAGKSHIACHPCYQNFKLESYIGAPLIVEGKPYGTLNFSAAAPRASAFSQDDHDFIELMAYWTGFEIARQAKSNQIVAQQKHMTQQQNLLEEMGKLAGVGAWEVDLINKTIYWSDVTRKIHEVDDDFVPQLDTGINFYKEGDSRERIAQLVKYTIETGEYFSGEFELITHKGREIWVASQGQAEFENGECVKIYGAFQDITEQVHIRQQLESRNIELSQALAARSMFLANMSHEIRTPMNGVLGMLQVLDRKNLNEKQLHQLKVAYDSANALLGLVNDILDFTKIDSGQLKLEFIPFNINELLGSCINAFVPVADAKDLRLTSDLTTTANKNILSDPTRIRQVCANLISNAVKFTHNGSVSLTSDWQDINEQTATLVIAVKDSGVGIAKEQIDKIFMPFQQADISTTRKYGGSGLGLAITKNLIKLMGGELSILSYAGKGSLFKVEIPVSIAMDALTDKTVHPVTVAKPLQNLHVLVVEDNEINQAVIIEMLRKLEISVDVADDGLAALKLINTAETPYSAILMDCQMPNMDGYEATENIRHMPGWQAQLPIIAMTANAMSGEREKCLAAGMTDYLSKPLEFEKLQTMLQKYSPN
jgi:two-component system, sensor histidine kinase